MTHHFDWARVLLPVPPVTIGSLIVYVGLRLTSLPFAHEAEPSSVTTLAASLGVATLAETPLRLEPRALEGAEVTFYNVNTRETEAFYFRNDGVISSEDEKRLEHLFRCKRTGHRRSVNRGLITILARLGAKYPGRVFELVSAHRAAPASVRSSKHYSGHAVDLRVRGVSLVDLRTFVWEEMTDLPMGVGYYRGEGFIHVDHRPGEPSIAWDQVKPGRSYRYHPRWSRRGRNS